MTILKCCWKKKKKKEEAEKLKQEKKEERERKKKEREEKMKEKEAKKKEREAKKKEKETKQKEKNTKRKRSSLRQRLLSSDDEDPPPIQSPSTSHTTSAKDTSESDPGANVRPSRSTRLPTRFRAESDDENDGVMCALYHRNEPEGLAASIVFWVDCDKCGCWVHNYCAFNKKNDVTRGYVCSSCT